MGTERAPQRTQPLRRDGRTRVGRPLCGFVALCAIAAVAHVLRSGLAERPEWRNAVLSALWLVLPSLGCAWLAQTTWRSRLPLPLRAVLALALAYHALFAPVLLLGLAFEPTTRNDDFALRAWPHVVHAINSLE